MCSSDLRTDLYGLGAVLYECLTGTVLFQGGSIVETMVQQINAAPQPLSERTPAARVPPRLEAIVMRCLAKKPGERYASGEALAEALKHFRDEEEAAPIVALLAEGTTAVPRRPDRRPYAFAALLLLLLVGGAWFGLWAPSTDQIGRAHV